MEKFFTPNKFFLGFCIFCVLEWFGLQLVSYLHLTNQAKLDGERIFNWTWSSKNIRSIAEIYETKIISRTNNDATIKVGVKKYLKPFSDDQNLNKTTVTDKCAAKFSYYRMNNKWFLGKVEFE